jgi:hypothetical protein
VTNRLRRWLYRQLRADIEKAIRSELLSSDCCCSAMPHRYT